MSIVVKTCKKNIHTINIKYKLNLPQFSSLSMSKIIIIHISKRQKKL